jgi:hypothetical protein
MDKLNHIISHLILMILHQVIDRTQRIYMVIYNKEMVNQLLNHIINQLMQIIIHLIMDIIQLSLMGLDSICKVIHNTTTHLFKIIIIVTMSKINITNIIMLSN